jgi:hypothetical protein
MSSIENRRKICDIISDQIKNSNKPNYPVSQIAKKITAKGNNQFNLKTIMDNLKKMNEDLKKMVIDEVQEEKAETFTQVPTTPFTVFSFGTPPESLNSSRNKRIRERSRSKSVKSYNTKDDNNNKTVSKMLTYGDEDKVKEKKSKRSRSGGSKKMNKTRRKKNK